MNNYFLSEKNEIKNKINLVLYFTILAYIISLFLKDAPVISNILMALILILSFFSPSDHTKWQRILKNKISVGIIIFYLYQVLSVALSANMKSGVAILMLRLPLLILPLAFCFIDFEKRTWNKIVLFFAIATTIASIIGFAFGVYLSIKENDSGNLYNDNISDFIGKQAVYFALYVGVAIMVFVIQLKEQPPIIQRYRFWVYSAVVWLLFITFMLASRTAMIGLLFILIIYILKSSIERKKIMEAALLVFCILIGSVIISKIFPKILNKFKGTTEITFQFDNKNVENHFNAEYDETKWNGTNTRAAIWTCAIDVWKAQPVMGTGLGDRDDELMGKYKVNKFWYGLGSEKNTHNQYLDILMSMGVIGLFVFLITFFIYPFKMFFKQKQFFSITVYLLLAICFLTETMLARYQGLVFISFIMPLAAKMVNEK